VRVFPETTGDQLSVSLIRRAPPYRRRIDGSTQSEAALSFAISEAALRDASVVAVHSVADPYLGSGSFAPVPERVRAREEAGTQFLHDDLEPWRSKHPEIDITATLTHEPAEIALAAHASEADMLVVGTRGRNASTGMFLGSVSHAALHAATVPVILLHAEPPMTR
jgi:nucleotide-binding universal stress UspA family protein